jgi:hypothetical protein
MSCPVLEAVLVMRRQEEPELKDQRVFTILLSATAHHCRFLPWEEKRYTARPQALIASSFGRLQESRPDLHIAECLL